MFAIINQGWSVGNCFFELSARTGGALQTLVLTPFR